MVIVICFNQNSQNKNKFSQPRITCDVMAGFWAQTGSAQCCGVADGEDCITVTGNTPGKCEVGWCKV